MRLARPALALLALSAALLAGCGGGSDTQTTRVGPTPRIPQHGGSEQAAQKLGFPAFATKNTTRVGGSDPVADAAAVAHAVYPGRAAGMRPRAVTLVDQRSWQAGVAGAVLMAAPLRAPVLLAHETALPKATRDALAGLAPTGFPALQGVQVVRIGEVPVPAGLRSIQLRAPDPAALADVIDRLRATLVGKPSSQVLVVSSEQPAFAMPAAAWAAKSGDPVLFVRRDWVPTTTRRAIARHGRPRIYVLGPASVISPRTEAALRALGSVTRVGAPDPVANAIAFARYLAPDRSFGWGIVDPGHGLVFASPRRPLDAAAAAALSTSGTYGPLLLVDGPAGTLSPAVRDYLLDIQPGYDRDPVRGVYNRAWLVGDDPVLGPSVQAEIDSLLEIVPVDRLSSR